MTDDIVSRLRAVPTKGNGMCCGSNSTIPNPYHNRCQEAADEIERLRAELQLAHSQIAIMATAKNEEEPL